MVLGYPGNLKMEFAARKVLALGLIAFVEVCFPVAILAGIGLGCEFLGPCPMIRYRLNVTGSWY
jgi:hypothetical protein